MRRGLEYRTWPASIAARPRLASPRLAVRCTTASVASRRFDKNQATDTIDQGRRHGKGTRNISVSSAATNSAPVPSDMTSLLILCLRSRSAIAPSRRFDRRSKRQGHLYQHPTFHRRHLHLELLLHAEQSPRKGRSTTSMFSGMAPACLESIPAPMCLVPPIRRDGVDHLAGGGGEFPNSSEDHAAGRADAMA
jgi:hypothetical protein